VFKFFDRYVIKELIPPFLIGLLIYTFVLLMNEILRLSEVFITRGVSFSVIVTFLIYLIPSILAFTIPMAVLMGILGGLSRLSSDSEIMAFKTLGISYKRLLRPVLLFALCGWLVTSYLALYLAPRANYKVIQTLSQSVLSKVQFRIHPRKFNESIPNTVIFIQDIDQRGEWENVFVYFSDPPEEPKAISAKRGRLNFYPEMRRATIELFDGFSHSYLLSEPDKYEVASFERFEEEINVENLFSDISQKKRVREKDIEELLRDIGIINQDIADFDEEKVESKEKISSYSRRLKERVSYWVEIHKKFALPFVCLIFGILGLPLGASTKKGGRTSGFTISLGIILFYYILISTGEEMAMDGKISPWLGMWGPNILLLMIGFFLLIRSVRETPLFPRFFRFSKKKKKMAPSPKKNALSKNWPHLSLRFPNILVRYII